MTSEGRVSQPIDAENLGERKPTKLSLILLGLLNQIINGMYFGEEEYIQPDEENCEKGWDRRDVPVVHRFYTRKEPIKWPCHPLMFRE